MEMKHKISIIVAIIGAIAVILAAIIENGGMKIEDKEQETVSTIKGSDITIEGKENIIINGDENEIVNENNIISNYIIKSRDYTFSDKTNTELFRMAKFACLEEDYEYAYEIYTSSKISNTKEALLNRGYLLSSEKVQREDNFQKAIECYENIEEMDENVYRNLLAAALKAEHSSELDYEELITKVLLGLLFIYDDDVTWDYISNCLYGMPFNVYQDMYEITKEEFSFSIYELLEYKEEKMVFLTYSPEDTEFVKYIFFDENHWIDMKNEISGTTKSYKVYKPCFYIFVEDIEGLYFEER